MSFLATARVNYGSRLQRAELLGSRYPFAKEILAFYGRIAAFQREFYEQLPKLWGKRPIAPADGALRSQLNLPLLMEPFGRFLRVVEQSGPEPVAAQARDFRDVGEARWGKVLSEFWQTGLLESGAKGGNTESSSSGTLREFFPRAFLLPYAEFIVSAMLPPVLPMTVCRCPRCNSLPLLGVLRPEGDGGKRYLQCSFCSQEWEFRRILCAHCGEDDEHKQAVYVAEQFPQVRIETCETCRHFLRTIDLTIEGNAVPLVDDLAAIPLRLWAEEHGYKRIQENLFGT